MASILAEFGANIIAVSSKQEPDDELKKLFQASVLSSQLSHVTFAKEVKLSH